MVENTVRNARAAVRQLGGDVYFDFSAKARVIGEHEGVQIRVLEQVTWKASVRVAGSDSVVVIVNRTEVLPESTNLPVLPNPGKTSATNENPATRTSQSKPDVFPREPLPQSRPDPTAENPATKTTQTKPDVFPREPLPQSRPDPTAENPATKTTQTKPDVFPREPLPQSRPGPTTSSPKPSAPAPKPKPTPGVFGRTVPRVLGGLGALGSLGSINDLREAFEGRLEVQLEGMSAADYPNGHEFKDVYIGEDERGAISTGTVRVGRNIFGRRRFYLVSLKRFLGNS